jgi:7-cyano-7-deazaguanine reductase
MAKKTPPSPRAGEPGKTAVKPAGKSAKDGGKSVGKRAPRAVSKALAKTAPQARIKVGARDMPPNPPTAPSKELHVFVNPASARDYVIQFQIPEFTCNCPLTGQPDFAHFTIDMICDELCIELKSLKMYMWSYRNEGSFHEKVTNTILDDIVGATRPRFVRITAKWYVRGGIYTNVVVEHRKRGWVQAPRVELPAVAALGTAIGML